MCLFDIFAKSTDFYLIYKNFITFLFPSISALLTSC